MTAYMGAGGWVQAFGIAAGTLGVCIAIWLQLVTPRRIEPKYVLGFLTLGSSLLLLNAGPLVPRVWPAIGVLAYTMLIVAQSVLAWHVWERSDVSPFRDTVDWAREVADDERE